jgi:hypothetical protein
MHEIEDALSPDSRQKIMLYYGGLRKKLPQMEKAV